MTQAQCAWLDRLARADRAGDQEAERTALETLAELGIDVVNPTQERAA